MDLQNFIRETIVQVSRGIAEANAELADSTAIVNPRCVRTATTDNSPIYGWMVTDPSKDNLRAAVQIIEFDVAVFAASGEESKKGAGLMVGALGVGAQGKSDSSNKSESRIRFKIPIVLPFSDKTQ
jgi:hypothetical protein